MCRIFGHYDVVVPPHELRTVSALQHHGGPDARSVVRGPCWALGNNRLAVMDLEGGCQPYDLDGIVKVVFNGEIYNHAELREELIAKGYRFGDRCDGSVLPALYAEYGTAFVERLDGMYAIAVMDLRDEPRLVLVTDELGMKPLYYQWDAVSGQLHFASEIPALLAFPSVDRTAWLHGLDTYLATKTPFGEQTMFEHIRALPPAATAVLTRGGGLRITTRRRRPQPAVVPADAGADDVATAGLQLRALLRDEVSRLLQADVPVAAITSGGLDSSLVSALAAEIMPDLHTFNIAYRGCWPHDEREFARVAAQRAGTRHHQVEVDPALFPELLPEVVWHMGQPNADPITVSTYALFGAVRAAGFKVALTGDGADELFGGYERLRAAMSVPADGDWVTSYVDALAGIPRALRHELYTSEYRQYLTAQETAADRLCDALTHSRRPRLETMTELEVADRLPAYHLRRVDHLSMAHGVEVRLTFCQPRVARFAQALSPHLRIRGQEVKRVLYRAAEGLLPTSVLSRPKQPFTLPIAAMLQPGQALFDYTQEVLAAANLRRHAMLEPAAVRRLLAKQALRPCDRTALAIWSLLIFELWLDQFGCLRPTSTVADLIEMTS
ncbi:MAG TPA: asparagine synthase (glutamine-hydrolyzing) [Solirubrobacteraceae bacterium]